MTAPAFRTLKESRAHRRLTLLTSSAGATVAPLVPEIDHVIAYDAPWLKATALRTNSRPEYELAAALRQAGFETEIEFPHWLADARQEHYFVDLIFSTGQYRLPATRLLCCFAPFNYCSIVDQKPGGLRPPGFW